MSKYKEIAEKILSYQRPDMHIHAIVSAAQHLDKDMKVSTTVHVIGDVDDMWVNNAVKRFIFANEDPLGKSKLEREVEELKLQVHEALCNKLATPLKDFFDVDENGLNEAIEGLIHVLESIEAEGGVIMLLLSKIDGSFPFALVNFGKVDMKWLLIDLKEFSNVLDGAISTAVKKLENKYIKEKTSEEAVQRTTLDGETIH